MKKILFLMALVFCFGSLMAKENEGAKELFEQSKQKLSFQNVHLLLDLQTFDAKGNSKSKSLSVAFAKINQEKKVMVEILAPEKVKGTKILTTRYVDKKGIIEIYMPASGKIQKFRASNRNLKIMGSEIPIAQFDPGAEEDYSFTLLSNKEIDGVLCYCIKVEKTDEKYFRLVYVSTNKKELLRVEKFDVKERMVSVTNMIDYMDVANSNGKIYPKYIEVRNLRTGKSSNMEVRKVEYFNKADPNKFQLQRKDS
ncbi:outer membrane lipoprotein-sorting protein [Ancylomarina longa]|uniref:outer membrane lipoprotein-sorting protein n=1 Tax=Ancylomarina longa TaxID=2487017 RepID=UPI001ADE0F87|nr:outer membrane lipoprotein-sorting protein [Ancylomarina longa]